MKKSLFFAGLVMLLYLTACGGSGGGGGSTPTPPYTPTTPITPVNSLYVVFAWNDLGMHCLNPTYDKAVVLPPYNNLYAQVVLRGTPPKVVNSAINVTYRVVDNTYSYGKTDSLGAAFKGFWDYCLSIFGATLAPNTGLNLVDPTVHNGLSGSMLAKTDYYVADGIPVVPVNDTGVWNPYQVAEVTVKDGAGNVLAQTRTTIPTSDELNCAKCHGATDPFGSMLQSHDTLHGTALVNSTPVLCANGSCHSSPALGEPAPASPTGYLSYAIHNAHSTRGAACYDCHPGANTKCNRSIAHYNRGAADGNCTTCHGQLTNVAASIANGTRAPWIDEPKCASTSCHSGSIAQVDTGSALYRNSRGHGNLFCESCHSSPHAMVPSTKDSDNYQAVQYQGKAVTIASCRVCHDTSRGGGSPTEFITMHGGTVPQTFSACNICHTSVTSSNTALWPHSFQWKTR